MNQTIEEVLNTYTLKQLIRLRRLVFIIVVIGIAVSVAMNVLYAPPGWKAKGAAAALPLLLFGAIEMFARIPGLGKKADVVRVIGAGVVTACTAVLSFSHQKQAVMDLGFVEWESWLWPLGVDGFMTVAAMSLTNVIILIRAKRNQLEQGSGGRQQRDRNAGLVETPGAVAFRNAMANGQFVAPTTVPHTVLNGSKPAIAAAAKVEGEHEV